jgi:hypothetical protein
MRFHLSPLRDNVSHTYAAIRSSSAPALRRRHLLTLSPEANLSYPRPYTRLAKPSISSALCSNSHCSSRNSLRSYRQQNTYLSKPSATAARHCSYRRSMCRSQHATEAPSASIDVTKGREVLPQNVKPTHYNLTLEPNFETFKYEGKVVIEWV